MTLPQPLIDWASAVSQTTWAQDIAGSWMFPLLETVHVFSLIAVLGTIALVDCRLVGLASRSHSVTALSRQALPWTWGGFVLAVASGALMTAGQAGEYITNPAFQLKLLLIVLAGLNMAAFHLIPWRTVGSWDAGAPPPVSARLAGALSLALWIGVIACGRWIAFTHGT
ncbi:MAG: DUF6644 family protein [Caulobacteraceae bacterium]